jgi:aldehyde dehydrogenase (NAD+)
VLPEGNRKDIRNAVEAARAAMAWERNSAHGRAQVLYYLAENLAAQSPRLLALLGPLLGDAGAAAELEVQRSPACSTPPPGPTSSTAPCTSRHART